MQVITGGSGELSQYVAAHVWGLQLRHLLPPPAVAQHAQQLVLLLGEAHCRGSAPHTRLQGHLAHLLVAALPKVPPPADKSISSLLQPLDALRSPSPLASLTPTLAFDASLPVRRSDASRPLLCVLIGGARPRSCFQAKHVTFAQRAGTAPILCPFGDPARATW
jgi:hypothetical protein